MLIEKRTDNMNWRMSEQECINSLIAEMRMRFFKN